MVADVTVYVSLTCKLMIPQLQFHLKLAKQILINTIGVWVVPEVVSRHTRRQTNKQHKCLWQGINTIGSRQIMSIIGAANVVQKKLGTTAHVTPQLPCASIAMQYMQSLN